MDGEIHPAHHESQRLRAVVEFENGKLAAIFPICSTDAERETIMKALHRLGDNPERAEAA